MSRFVSIIASLVLVAPLAAQRDSAPRPPVTVPARARTAVVTILAYGATGDAFATATGAVASDGRVVTTLRPLRGALRAEIYGADGNLLTTVTALEQADTRKDLAVLPRVTGTARLVAARRRAEFGQRVAVLGPRGGVADGIAPATIAAVEESDRGRVMRLDAAIGAGFIGGPVVSARGEWLGVTVGAIVGRDEVGLAVDVADVRELLARPAGGRSPRAMASSWRQHRRPRQAARRNRRTRRRPPPSSIASARLLGRPPRARS
jgi:S1-C subfamily serine protease